jgi:hypothetical protein
LAIFQERAGQAPPGQRRYPVVEGHRESAVRLADTLADVSANQAPKMLLVQRDDVVEDLTAATADPSFRGSVLP